MAKRGYGGGREKAVKLTITQRLPISLLRGQLIYLIGKFDLCGARIAKRFLELRVSQPQLIIV